MSGNGITIIEQNAMHAVINISQTMHDISKTLADISETLKVIAGVDNNEKKEGK